MRLFECRPGDICELKLRVRVGSQLNGGIMCRIAPLVGGESEAMILPLHSEVVRIEPPWDTREGQ